MNWNDIFEYSDGNLLNKKTKHVYCNKDRDGYIRVRVMRREFRAHRIIWELVNNSTIPEGILVDHIDGNTSNNKIDNLRLATRQENNKNSTKNIITRELPKGITLNTSGKYRARITSKGITYSLGTFKTIEEAVSAFNEKGYELDPEFFRETKL